MKLFFNILVGYFSKRDGLDKLKNRFKFIFRSLLTLPWTLRWLNEINKNPDLKNYLKLSPNLATKLHRPYLYKSLGSSGKLSALISHYHIMRNRFSISLYSRLINQESITIGTILGKNGKKLRLVLTQNHSFTKEGELSLQLYNSENIAVSTLTFSLTYLKCDVNIVIGGLQGPHRPFGTDEVRCATKDCHGLLPKRLVVDTLIIIAQYLNATKILAVGNFEHVYSSIRYRRNLTFNYGDFWLTLDAQKIDGKDMFTLPVYQSRKKIDVIVSKKRAEYQRRYDLMDDLKRQVTEHLLISAARQN